MVHSLYDHYRGQSRNVRISFEKKLNEVIYEEKSVKEDNQIKNNQNKQTTYRVSY